MKKLAFLFLFFTLWSPTAQAFGITHHFFVTIGAFDASDTFFTYSLNNKDYGITSNIITSGLFNTLYPFNATYETSGKIKNGSLVVQDSNYNSKSRFNSRSKQIFYTLDGKPRYQISSKNNKQKRKDFDLSGEVADTFDLQTVIAKLTYQYNQLGFCNSTQSVFDGKHRFDVVFNDDGEEELLPDEHSFFSGKTARCTLKINKATSEEDDTLWQFASDRLIYFWIARDQKTNYPFIARVKIKDTPLGDLTAYLSDIKIEE